MQHHLADSGFPERRYWKSHAKKKPAKSLSQKSTKEPTPCYTGTSTGISPCSSGMSSGLATPNVIFHPGMQQHNICNGAAPIVGFILVPWQQSQPQQQAQQQWQRQPIPRQRVDSIEQVPKPPSFESNLACQLVGETARTDMPKTSREFRTQSWADMVEGEHSEDESSIKMSLADALASPEPIEPVTISLDASISFHDPTASGSDSMKNSSKEEVAKSDKPADPVFSLIAGLRQAALHDQ